MFFHLSMEHQGTTLINKYLLSVIYCAVHVHSGFKVNCSSVVFSMKQVVDQ